MTVFVDDFNRADDATGLGPNWGYEYSAPSGSYGIASNQAYQSVSGGGRLARRTDANLTGDQYAQLTVKVLPSGAGSWQAGPAVKISSSGFQFFGFTWGLGGAIRLMNNAGELKAATIAAIKVGDILRNECVGGVFTLKVNGVAVLTHDMSSAPPTGTQVGFFGYSGNSEARIDDFEGGDLAPTGSPPTGTVTIGTITKTHNSASVAFTYSASDQTGFKYRLNGGTAASAGTASPLALSGLTPSTAYTVEIRATNATGDGAWSAVGNFTTDAAPTVTTLKLLAHSDAAGATAVKGAVFAAPSGGALTGAKIGEFTGKSFSATLESGQAVLTVPVADFGGSSLTTADTPVVVWQGTSASGSPIGNAVGIGSVGAQACTVVNI